MKRILFVIIHFFIFAISCSYGQTYTDSLCENYVDNDFLILSRTNDRFFWQEDCYIINRSPLHIFRKYDSLYPVITMIDCIHYLTIGDRSLAREKNYYVDWYLLDSMLYLVRIHFDAINNDEEEIGYFPFHDQYKRLEQLTGGAFSYTRVLFLKNLNNISPLGIMPATWFTGMLYGKKIKAKDEDFELWKTKPYSRFLFRKGKLCAVDEINRLTQ